MKRSTLFLVVPLASAISSVAIAQPQTSAVRDNDFNWRFFQFGLELQDRGRGFDRDAVYGRLSWALDEHLFLRGGLSLYDGDLGAADYDGLGLSGGLGFHTRCSRASIWCLPVTFCLTGSRLATIVTANRVCVWLAAYAIAPLIR